METQSRSIILLTLLALTGCATRRPHIGETDSIPVTFEVYAWRSSLDLPLESRPYDSIHIHRLMSGVCMFAYQFDAAKGVPIPSLRQSSRAFKKGRIQLPASDYIKGTEWLRALMPDFYQGVGYLEYYLVRFDTDGRILRVVPEITGGILPGRDLFRRCQPGDKIIAEWSF